MSELVPKKRKVKKKIIQRNQITNQEPSNMYSSLNTKEGPSTQRIKMETANDRIAYPKMNPEAYNFDNSCEWPCTQNRYLHIDSRQRDISKWPNSHEFTIKFNERYENIISLKVLHAIIPKTDYNINESNNVIDVREVDINEATLFTYSVTLPIGNYTAGTFASTIQSSLIAASLASGGSYTFVVTINASAPDTNKLSINAGAGEYFQLLFSSGTNADSLSSTGTTYSQDNYVEKGTSARIPMGFSSIIADQKNYSDTVIPIVGGVTPIISTGTIDLSGELYCLLEIRTGNNMDRVDNLEATDYVGNDMAFKLPLNQSLNFIKSYEIYHEIEKIWRMPREFSQMSFRLLDYYGGIYNLRGTDYSLTLMIKEMTGQTALDDYEQNKSI